MLPQRRSRSAGGHWPVLRSTLSVAAMMLSASIALAAPPYNAPKRAKQFKSAVVTAYQPCTTPNDTALFDANGGLPACNPPVRVDPSCGFGPNGRGKIDLKMTSSPGWVATGYTYILTGLDLKGLEPACEGETLELTLRVRVTTDDSGAAQSCGLGGSCTIQDIDVGETCLVVDGRCSNPLSADGIGINSGATSVELIGCAVEHGGVPAFSCGLFTEVHE
jgi:hypothetical protein